MTCGPASSAACGLRDHHGPARAASSFHDATACRGTGSLRPADALPHKRPPGDDSGVATVRSPCTRCTLSARDVGTFLPTGRRCSVARGGSSFPPGRPTAPPRSAERAQGNRVRSDPTVRRTHVVDQDHQCVVIPPAGSTCSPAGAAAWSSDRRGKVDVHCTMSTSAPENFRAMLTASRSAKVHTTTGPDSQQHNPGRRHHPDRLFNDLMAIRERCYPSAATINSLGPLRTAAVTLALLRILTSISALWRIVKGCSTAGQPSIACRRELPQGALRGVSALPLPMAPSTAPLYPLSVSNVIRVPTAANRRIMTWPFFGTVFHNPIATSRTCRTGR